jgi:hypothetical protein
MISILKYEIEKNNLKKNITKIKKRKKKENTTLWIIIIIHSAISMGEQWFLHII